MKNKNRTIKKVEQMEGLVGRLGNLLRNFKRDMRKLKEKQDNDNDQDEAENLLKSL